MSCSIRTLGGYNVALRICGETPVGEYRCRYNQPVVPEIVAIVLDEQYMESNQDIILHQHGGDLQWIKEIHLAYDALSIYPILCCFQMVDMGGHLLLKQLLE